MNKQSLLLALSFLLSSQAALAQSTDGSYGRLNGRFLAAQLDLGAAVDARASTALTTLALRYLQTAGIYASLQSDLRGDDHARAPSASVGVELRPLFLPRFLKNLQKGPSRLDLSIDSLALRTGAILSPRPYAEPAQPGFEFMLCMGLPLSTSAHGPWVTLTTGLRADHAALSSRAPAAFSDLAFVGLTLGWQHIFAAGVVDLGDARR